MSENKLECLPDELGGLVNLTDLMLSQNQLEELPHSIGTWRPPQRRQCWRGARDVITASARSIARVTSSSD